MTIGSLFSGIGGLELGLERAGLGPVLWQCEIDPFCRLVLERRWPDAVRARDVRAIHVALAIVPIVDLVCGGFPCQDVASHGSRAGLDGARSGLWHEMNRIVAEFRPAWVVIENVEALRRRGLDRVLSDLAARGYDAEWQTIRAADVGAPHGRPRLFIVAHACAVGCPLFGAPHDLDWDLACRDVANRCRAAFPPGERDHATWRAFGTDRPTPGVRRVVDGIPDRVDRISALGNAVVPAMSEAVGRAIVHALENP